MTSSNTSLLRVLGMTIAVVVVLLAISEITSARAPHRGDDHCDCHYQPDRKGCVITRGPFLAGFKCRCRVRVGFFITHCIGTRIGCNTGESCPAGCASKECCLLAGGNCDGY